MRILALLLSVFLLTSCSSAVKTAGSLAAGALTDGGPKVSANAQIGKTNTQAVGKTKILEMKGPVARPENVETFTQTSTQSSDENHVNADRVETVVVNQIPNWLLAGMAGMIFLFGLVGWLSPQPQWMRE